jgi:hypothetical protein
MITPLERSVISSYNVATLVNIGHMTVHSKLIIKISLSICNPIYLSPFIMAYNLFYAPKSFSYMGA